jgi:uncharacterized protein (DUF1015 family)
MAKLIPFRNFHYKNGKNNPERLREFVAPPYDVISEEEEHELKQRDPKNISHIILPESYEKAGKELNDMIESETLMCEDDRCICIYGIEYEHPETGKKVSRYGFVGLLELVDIFPPVNGVIPHEATFKKYLEDRLNLIRETDGNFSPIFTIYDGDGAADEMFEKYISKEPHLQVKDRDGFTHKIWEVWKEEDIEVFQDIVENNKIIIADGHHRYITSLRHSKDGGCNYIMAMFIDFNDPGLVIFTSHRQVHNMPVDTIAQLKEKAENYFTITEMDSCAQVKEQLEVKRENHVFGCYFQDRYLFFELKDHIEPEKIIPGDKPDEWKKLDIPILHKILFEKCLTIGNEDISFIKDTDKGIDHVDEGRIDALFLINPTKLEEVQRITNLGEIMPQKSTYFYPKPLSGLVIHKHTDTIE